MLYDTLTASKSASWLRLFSRCEFAVGSSKRRWMPSRTSTPRSPPKASEKRGGQSGLILVMFERRYRKYQTCTTGLAVLSGFLRYLHVGVTYPHQVWSYTDRALNPTIFQRFSWVWCVCPVVHKSYMLGTWNSKLHHCMDRAN